MFNSPCALSPPNLSAPVFQNSQPHVRHLNLFKQENYSINVGLIFQELSSLTFDQQFIDKIRQTLSTTWLPANVLC